MENQMVEKKIPLSLKKKYRRRIALLIIVIIFISILIYLFRDKAYDIEYKVNDVLVNEEYNSVDDYYYMDILYDKVNYQLLVESSYEGRKFINEVKVYEEDTDICLKVDTLINSNILCSRDSLLVSNHLVNEELRNKLDIKLVSSDLVNTDGYDIFNDIDNLYIWNYKGFDLINNKEVSEISLFKSDVYDTHLIGYVDNYFVMPNYNQEYSYDEMIFINLDNNKEEVFEMDYSLSDDGYVIGTYDKSIYYMDIKNEVIYEIVPDKEKMRIYGTINGSVDFLINGEFVSTKVSVILKDKMVFSYDSLYSYELIDNTLYLRYLNNERILVSDLVVDKIIYSNNIYVVYLVGDTLYSYDGEEKKLLSNDEWLFNSDDKIFKIIE